MRGVMRPGHSIIYYRRIWQYLGIATVLLVVLHSIAPSRPTTESVTGFFPPTFWRKPPSKIRPGGYFDVSRQRKVPDASEEELLEEDAIGTLHDERNEKFYAGGIKSLTSGSYQRQVVYDPYPDYNGEEWRKQWQGDFVACEGPRGTVLDRNNADDMMSVYLGNQRDFPFPMFGSHEALNLDSAVCADRCSRWAIYGHEETKRHTSCPKTVRIDWDQVTWGSLQSQCAERNANRSSLPLQPAYRSQSALIIRSYDGMKWSPTHRQYLRSLIMELSLHSGGEYQVYLLVDVKAPLNIHDDTAVRQFTAEHIPAEFHDITILFNADMLREWYPMIDEHTPVYQHLQPIQVFSQLYPNFDYYLQLEMDSRNTGHMYHFLEQAASFAKAQPRKYLWERNAYFYTPGAHGTWENFTHMVDKSLQGRELSTVWGPVAAPVEANIQPIGPKPPVADPLLDDYQWGVGEEADLITLLPIFDAGNTTWTFPDKIWNVPPSLPRRASPITMWRMSHRLLAAMHNSLDSDGVAIVSEMSGPTFALLHGLKAVAVPQPIYLDGQWSAREVASIVNRDTSTPEKINGGSESVWNWNHAWDHILYRVTYMFTTQTAEDLFRRWLGYKADEGQYTDGSPHRDPQGRFWYDEGKLNEQRYGRLCFPGMMLHTVKNTELVKGQDMAVPV
ncbi:hypothetical protein DL546_007033 [Coniochaeta pulveracea]|uniref:Uncharacterized protein n=1 Tax=Coniochaeta pulveracea TaxID=177199 RepID=A0A420Y955_9PEZI|nr:hypothetical protein DL546_007033 [Coniochaeta pulveracea]